MGTIRNEMTIVHDWKKEKVEELREDAIKVFREVIRQDLGNEEFVENMISPVMQSYINREYTFIINGDCSKLGWGTSESFHEARMEWCEKNKNIPQNIIVINFGEGDEPSYIAFDNRAKREDEK